VLRDRLSDALTRAWRSRSTVAVLCLDLDHFKDVNDTLGHAAGDRLLNLVVMRLQDNIRAVDTLARLGGDEFAIVQSGGIQPHFAETLAARLITLLAQPFDLDGHQAVIGVSIGIAIATGEDGVVSPEVMLQQGDMALYSAKAAGRSAFRFFQQEMNDSLAHRKELEADLRKALAEGQFTLNFQPQVSLGAGGQSPVIQGAEALIRWTSPTRGVMGPNVFIPLAEETGLIVPIGEWVMREACAAAMGWSRPLSVAVNVSAVQFRRAGFIAMVEDALASSGLPAERLEIEITESVMMEDESAAMAVMDSLREMGVRVAMDDFGTGYSSLGYLRKFRFDKIKIDRSFVQGLGKSGEADAIVRAVVGMSHALGIRANAEGVETAEQAALLSIEGCAEVQGFLFGRPMPGPAFAELVALSAETDLREIAQPGAQFAEP
jgi:diguanylate cyclase (GGDEF)-like protein